MKTLRMFIALMLLFAIGAPAYAKAQLSNRTSAPGFAANLGDNQTEVVIGGKDLANNEFEPEIYWSAFDDEAWVNMDFQGGPRVDKANVTYLDGKVTYSHPAGWLFEYYVLPNGNLEWAGVFPSDPKSYTATFKLTHSNNVSFHQQILTAEQTARGDQYDRPEAEGSYAIYIDKRDNRYKTGKIGHIFRPKVIDNNGEEVWCDLSIIPDGVGGHDMIITLPPSQWWKSAAYPVVLDPEIGYSTKGVKLISTTGFALAWEMGQATESGPVTALKGYVKVEAGNFKVAVAKTDETSPNYYASGQDVVSQGEGAAGSNPSSCSVANTEDLVSGNHYRLLIVLETVGSYISYDTLSVKSYRRERTSATITYADYFPSTLPALANQNATGDTLSIWAEYGAASPSTTIQSHLGYKQIVF